MGIWNPEALLSAQSTKKYFCMLNVRAAHLATNWPQ